MRPIQRRIFDLGLFWLTESEKELETVRFLFEAVYTFNGLFLFFHVFIKSWFHEGFEAETSKNDMVLSMLLRNVFENVKEKPCV